MATKDRSIREFDMAEQEADRGDNRRRPALGRTLGLFITFEGCEGSGKTTQVEMLKEHLTSLGHDVVVSREPGGTLLGEKIREILLDRRYDGLSAVTEALLFAADRAQQVEEIVRPALERGLIVLGDRFVDSSLAYQGVARRLGIEAVKNLNDWATGGVEPTLTFYLDMPVGQALARKSRDKADRMESEPVEFHENVRHAYGTIARLFSNRIVVLDAAASRTEIHANVVNEVSKIL